ncbi:MAG: sulfatase-like hydrolase/transferase [Planctomycetes bacterium]|nr:sulfatase-like hydrolase/transferase [Planctomycetota bacterium]
MNRRPCKAALYAALSVQWLTGGVFAAAEEPRAPRRPNVVFILTDNHGAWTLGCYGNRDIRTPHIDRLAAEGVRFTRAFSSNAVCSPTRATFLTGLLPSQHGVHCFLRAGHAQMGPDAYSTIAEFRTLPEILAEAGYACGLSGKWHLGNNLHPQEGFSDWITMPHGGTSTFYDADVIEDGRVRKEPQYLTDLWTERGVRFIEQNKDRPFFLFLAYNGPYSLGRLLLRPARNRHVETYADELLPSFPREQMHPWQFNNKEYLNNIVSIRRVAAEVSGVDDGVGRILEALKQHGLDEQTLVIFTADQGWVGGQHGLWGMGDHTRPLSAFDGMLHIPLIFRHTGSIPAGQVSDLMTSNYDFLPTVLSYLGLADKLSAQPQSPGRDYSPTLKGRRQEWDNTVYYDFETVRAIRTADWKYVERFPDGPHELYDLKADSGEQFNLYGQPLQVETQGALRDRLHEFFDRHADPQYDLWRGGRSKTHLLSAGGAMRLPSAMNYGCGATAAGGAPPAFKRWRSSPGVHTETGE